MCWIVGRQFRKFPYFSPIVCIVIRRNARAFLSDQASRVSATNFASAKACFTLVMTRSEAKGNASRQSVLRDRTVNPGSIVFIARKNEGWSTIESGHLMLMIKSCTITRVSFRWRGLWLIYFSTSEKQYSLSTIMLRTTYSAIRVAVGLSVVSSPSQISWSQVPASIGPFLSSVFVKHGVRSCTSMSWIVSW